VLQGETYEDAYAKALELCENEGFTFIHPFDDLTVMAGQGTIALEILEDLDSIDTIVVPIGGGGLISGIAVAAKAINPKVRVVGVEAAGAPSALKALEVGKLVSLERTQTIADGIRVAKIGGQTFEYLQNYVDEIVLVDDEEIALAMVEMMENSKLVVEGAGAVSVAAILNGRITNAGRTVCAILSGGNVDINLIARVVERGLVDAGRQALLRVRIIDQPGQLIRVLEVLASRRVNILDVEHHRAAWRVPVGSVDVELLVETRNAAHAREMTQLLVADGFDAKLLSGAG
jgi:threonine dehydratase